jgi:hypothetical protein
MITPLAPGGLGALLSAAALEHRRSIGRRRPIGALVFSSPLAGIDAQAGLPVPRACGHKGGDRTKARYGDGAQSDRRPEHAEI